MTYLVLVGGGHAAGKRTVCQDLKKVLLENKGDLNLSITLADLAEFQSDPFRPTVDFPAFIDYINGLKSADSEVVVLVHGNYALADAKLRDMAQVKVFVDTDADSRLSQWILRDVCDKTPLDTVLTKYLEKCRPEFQKHIEPTKKYADVLLPKGSDTLGIMVMATSMLDQIRLAGVGDSQPVVPILTSLDLRREVLEEDQRYYAAI